VERIVVTAKLKPGSHDAAAEVLRAGPPYDPGDLGLVRNGVYLGASEIVFVFEGADVEQRLRDLLNDPAASAAFAVWGPLLEGTPSAAHELFYWEAPPKDWAPTELVGGLTYDEGNPPWAGVSGSLDPPTLTGPVDALLSRGLLWRS
jgi:hypothetical protein